MPAPAPLPLDRFAELAARIDIGTPRDEVLAAHGVTDDVWDATQSTWLSRIGEQTGAGRLALGERYTTLFVKHRREALEQRAAARRSARDERRASPAEVAIVVGKTWFTRDHAHAGEASTAPRAHVAPSHASASPPAVLPTLHAPVVFAPISAPPAAPRVAPPPIGAPPAPPPMVAPVRAAAAQPARSDAASAPRSNGFSADYLAALEAQSRKAAGGRSAEYAATDRDAAPPAMPRASNEPRLAIEQFASLRAELVATAEAQHGAVHARYGLDRAAWDAEDAAWERRFAAEPPLFDRYLQYFRYMRGLLPPRG